MRYYVVAMAGSNPAGGRGRSRSRPGTRRPAQSRSPSLPRGAETVGRNVAALRDVVTKGVLAPINAVLLTRRHIEEVVEDAVIRGRMTRDDAQQLIQSLLQRGARQTEDFIADLERLLGRGREFEEEPSRRRSERAASQNRRPRRSQAAPSNLPIARYDQLSAAQVQERLEGLSAADLRRLRDYERRHANRKTVLDPIERRLR
jgi:polyhydroxyalkanoate synthesis regulator phasin